MHPRYVVMHGWAWSNSEFGYFAYDTLLAQIKWFSTTAPKWYPVGWQHK